MGRARYFLLATIAMAGLGAIAATGSAQAGFSALKGEAAAAGPGLVQQVHGCHRSVQRDRGRWHYHAGRSCRWVEVPPPRPVCWKDCKYVGPVKVCKTKCR
jgi:hypothetical protein